MKNLLKLCLVILSIGILSIAARAQFGTICGDPSQKQCTGQYEGFKPQDLIFNTGRTEFVVGESYESNEFYAVILESVKADRFTNGNCRFVSETKRRAAQKLFPKNKVFASRQNCSGYIVQYHGASDDYNFMAIYAGETEAQAAAILKKAKQKYAGANIRKMKVILDFADE